MSPRKQKAKSQPLRLNRLLAQWGVTSRRKADELIKTGRISINGETVRELGTQVVPAEVDIEVDGVPLERKSPSREYFAFHKPAKVVTTLNDPEGRPTIKDYFPSKARLFPVGRLDFDAEGLLLLTNDGDIANQLLHPKFEVPKTYRAKVKGRPEPSTIARLRKGFRLEDGFAKPLRVTYEKRAKEHTWYRITVTEGRHHLIKRLWMRAGHPVRKLVRTSIGNIQLGQLPAGKSRQLTREEIKQLQNPGQKKSKPRTRSRRAPSRKS